MKEALTQNTVLTQLRSFIYHVSALLTLNRPTSSECLREIAKPFSPCTYVHTTDNDFYRCPRAHSMAFTSALSRAQNTLEIQLKEIDQEGISVTKDQALNERDYGELTGLNKDDARKKWGEEQVS